MANKPCSLQILQAAHVTALICLLIITLIITTPLLGILGQQSITDFVYRICSFHAFSSSDTFAANYNAVVASLQQSSHKSLYGTATCNTSGAESDNVYGIYQCRGDVSVSDCASCVYNAFYRISQPATGGCGETRGGRALFQACFIRYESYAFDAGVRAQQQTGAYISAPRCSDSKISPPHSLYLHNLAVALHDSAIAAPHHALFGYNASTAGIGSHAGYALTQCMGYLSSSACATCLASVSNFSNACNQSMSGQVFFESCYYIYGNTSFLFTYTSSSDGMLSPPPASSPNVQVPAPPPASIPNVRVPPASTQYSAEGRKNKSTTPIIVGIVMGNCFVLVAIVIATLICFQKRRSAALTTEHTYSSQDGVLYATNTTSSLDNLLHQPRIIKFSIIELQEATSNFSRGNKLGEGGFGPVYQGRLTSGREVAIKMLSCGSHQGNKEFENEVNLITTVQHRNLIQLLGCCIEASQRLLVYEYLPYRSLDLHLFDVREKDALSWHTRFNLIVGIARGLSYLHEDSLVRIVHRDIKSSNILLDSNMSPKIADFGLARFFADDVSHVKTKVAGTLDRSGHEVARYRVSKSFP